MPLSQKLVVVPMLLVGVLTSHQIHLDRPLVITVEANDFSLALPARVPAGVVTFRLVNHGKETHHAQVIRLAADGLSGGSDPRADGAALAG